MFWEMHFMLKPIVLITTLLLTLAKAQAVGLGVGYVLDCTPIQQQFVVNQQVNNQLPIANPGRVRFAVLPDRSLQAKSLDQSKSALVQNNAQYAGEERFQFQALEIVASKWTKVDEFQASHNLYFAYTENNKWVLEERISKDQFKRMFVINYSCNLVSAPVISASSAAVEKLSSNLKGQIEPKQSLERPAEPVKPDLFKCSGTTILKMFKQSDQVSPSARSIPLSFDRLEGRFEISGGWDKTTENGITAWVDPKENNRNQRGQSGQKTSIYATLESKIEDTTTTLILKMDTLQLYVKYEKFSTGITDTFQGICTPDP